MKSAFGHFVGVTGVYSLPLMQAQLYQMGSAVIAPHLGQELALGTSELGLTIGVMFMAPAAAQPVYGVLLDRFGTVKAVSYMSPLAMIGMVLFTTADSAAQPTLGRASLGAVFTLVLSGL